MQRHGFKMKLYPGTEAEYQKCHDEIWPELVELLRNAGISNYSIHLDEESSTPLGYLERTDNHTMNDLPNDPIVKKWWKHMGDIMRCSPEGLPVVKHWTKSFSCHEYCCS